jgi:hypothetical protein
MRSSPLLAALALVCASASSPSQVPVSWKSVGAGGGGAFFAPAFSPFNHNILTLACDMTGLYRTTNLGASWGMYPFNHIEVGRNASKVGYTSDPNVQYILDATFDSQRPMVSTNGGGTWAPLAVDPSGGDAWYLKADPTTTNRLFVSDYANLFFSKDGGHTWLTVATDNSGSGIVLGDARFDGTRIIVGTSLGVYASTNGGASFVKDSRAGIPATEQIVNFAIAKAGSVTRMYAVTFGAGQVYGGIQGDDCFSFRNVYSLDYETGTTWAKRMTGIPASAHFFFVRTAGNDIQTVYLAGGDDSSAPCVYKSTNGGLTWVNVLKTANNQNILTGWQGDGGDRQWSYDQLCFGFDVCPGDSLRAAFTGFGFCHLTTNGGGVWHQAYVSAATQNAANTLTPKGKTYQGIGLENTSCWTLCWSDANHVWAGFSDIYGIRSTDGGSTWSFNYKGDSYNSGYQIVKAANGTLYMAVSNIHDMYESTHLIDSRIDSGSGGILRSTDAGATWTPVHLGKVAVGVATDPNNANRLYASFANSQTGGIYVTNNLSQGAASIWTKLASPPRTQGHALSIVVLKDGTLVCSFSGRRTTNFTDSSGVFVSTNGGTSWIDRSAPGMHYWTKDVVIDPTDASQNTWYAGVYSGWGGLANDLGGLYKTKNRGLSWT